MNTLNRLSLTVIALALLTGLTLATHAATVTWNGSVNDDWAESGNWTGGVPGPGDAPLFTNIDSGGTSILDTNRTVNGLRVRNPDDNSTHASINHALDLGSTEGPPSVVQRLIVDGNVGIGQYVLANAAFNSKNTSTLTVTNGTLQIGTSTTSRELNLGYRAPGNIGTPTRGELIVGSESTTTTFDSYLSTVRVGASQGASGLLDLRNAELVGNGQTGIFRATTLHMATSGHGNYFPAASQILFGSTLQALEVTGNLTMGSAQQTAGYLGQYGASGTTALPDTVDIKLGVSTSSPAAVSFATNWSSNAHLVASTGGDFTGYLSSLTVATNPGWPYDNNNRPATGRLDLRNMNSITLNVRDNTVIGQADVKVQNPANGFVHLGPGTATFNNLTIGPTYGSGLLDLYGTDTTVNGTLALNATGEILFNNGATLTLNGNADQNPTGVINGDGSLVKNGTGSLTLTGAQGYTGATTVNAGTLAMNHATSTNLVAGSSVIAVAAGATLDVGGLANGFEVGSGQTLKGSGSVTGDTTVASGTTLAPGASIGTLGFDNNLTLADGAIYNFESTSADALDLVTVGGVLDLNGTITVNLYNTGDFSRTQGPFLLFEATSVNSDDLVGWNIVLHDFWYVSGVPAVSIDGGNVYLEGAAFIPEPTSLALLALAALALGLRRR